MKAKFAICLILIWVVLAGAFSRADVQDPARPDDLQIKRLAGLCKLWGTVKYFHPYLAYKPIDWDMALVQAIPRVKAASSTTEYQAALDYLLSFLDDPTTRTVRQETVQAPPAVGPENAVPAADEPSITWLQDHIALISATDYRGFTDSAKAARLPGLIEQASKADAVIFDIRRKDGDESSIYFFSRTYLQSLPALFQGSCPLPSSRHRMYSGYPTQTGGSSGGYYSGFVYDQQPALKGRAKSDRKINLIFLTNGRPNGLESELSGLQTAQMAVIIQEDDTQAAETAVSEPGSGMHFMTLTDGITASIRVTETVQPDGSVGFAPNATVPAADRRADGRDPALAMALDIATGRSQVKRPETQAVLPNPPLPKENPYAEMTYPSEEYRLLSLFRFWNVINFFFPYKHLLDRPWEETLEEFIPRLQNARDELDYALRVMELVTNIKDTHGFSSSPVFRKYIGTHVPPIEVKWIEGQTVVTHVLDNADGTLPEIRVGDVVLAVDGEGVAPRRERLSRTFAASTPQALRWRVHQSLLAGEEKSQARIKFKNAGGEIREISLTRTANFVRRERTTPLFRVLPEGFGYMDLARLTVPDVDKAFEAVKNTPAVIMDMRGYPKGTAWAIGPRLADKKLAVAQFRRPEPHGVFIDWPSQCAFDQTTEPDGQWRYTGKIVVLINEEAISQAEHTCLFLEAAAGATFIGSPTNGANGDVTTTVLPGAITVNFTGHDVRHADGRQLQRTGIQPHVRVEPTIEGIRAGRDEVLAKAVEFLRSKEKLPK
jgi:C-terminal processing protease CtpA/Prc